MPDFDIATIPKISFKCIKYKSPINSMYSITVMRSLVLNRYIALFVCIALFAKAVIPANFMPDFAALSRGSYKITICSGEGAKDIWVDQAQKSDDSVHHDPLGSKHQKSDHTCPFAGLHAFALPSAVPVALAGFFHGQFPYPPLADQRAGYTIGVSWPRGPPALLNS